MAQLRRRVETAYLDKAHALPLALVLQHPHELADAGVADAASKVAVALHTIHVQVLHTDGAHLAFVRQLVGNLVKVVSTAVGDVLMQPCYALLRAAVGTASLGLLRQAALQQLQLTSLLAGIVRAVELPAIGKHGKGLQSCVDADGGLLVACGRLLRRRHTVADKHACVVFAGGRLADGDGLHLVTEAAVQHGGYVLRLGYADGATVEIYAAMLRALEALAVVFALELREPGRTAKEVVVGRAKVTDAHLERLRVDLAQPLLLGLQLGLHAVNERVGVDALALFLVCRGLYIERPVPYNTDAAEGLGQQHLLFLRRVDSVFVRSLHSPCIYTGKAAAAPSLSQLHNATGYVREAAAVWLVSGKRQPQTSVCVGAYAAPSCIGCFVVTVQRYEETLNLPNIFAIIFTITLRHSSTRLKTAWFSGAIL